MKVRRKVVGKMVSLTVVKLLCSFAMFIICFTTSVIPTIIHNRLTLLTVGGERVLRGRSKKVVSCLSCFGGGVFLATFFLGMLHEIEEKFNKWFKKIEYENEFPFYTLCCITGFIIIMLIEHLAIDFHKRSQKRKLKRAESELATKVSIVDTSGVNGNGEVIPLKEDGEFVC